MVEKAITAMTERRRVALREERANTNQSKWLARNCSDWRRAHEDIGGPTAEREMKRHCKIYERYLETGYAEPFTPIPPRETADTVSGNLLVLHAVTHSDRAPECFAGTRPL